MNPERGRPPLPPITGKLTDAELATGWGRRVEAESQQGQKGEESPNDPLESHP